MAQIAQQDNLVVVGTQPIASLDADAKNKLIACIQAGTINDVILKTPDVSKKDNYSKVIGWLVDTTSGSAKYKVAVYDFNTDAVKSIALN